MLIETNRIIVKDRIRKDYGDIEELAKDIKDNGLINPPVVNPSYELIAGERRLRALRYLGYKQIEVRVMSVQDALHQLKLEISENENRKDFTFSEKMKWAEELKNEYSKIAKENQTYGKNLPEVETGRVRDKIAKDLNIGSGETFRKSQYIYNNASEEMIKQLDEGQLSINKAYNDLKGKLKQEQLEKELLQKQLEAEKNKEPMVIDNTDYSTINRTKELEDALINERKEKDKLNYQLDSLHRKIKLYEEDSREYKKLQSEIEFLTKKKTDLGNQIQIVNDLSALVVEIENFLKNKLAPIKYSKSLLYAKNDEIVIENISDIVNSVRNWCDEMQEYIPNKENYVEVI